VKRVIVVPFSDAGRFPDLEVIARDRSLVALVGDTAPGRAREAYDSEDSFLEAAALGIADRYTFDTFDEAAIFARTKLDELAHAAQLIEDSINARATQRRQPEKHSNGLVEMFRRKKKA
jgi:hypothetical protein